MLTRLNADLFDHKRLGEGAPDRSALVARPAADRSLADAAARPMSDGSATR
jgi:hypothetical protein